MKRVISCSRGWHAGVWGIWKRKDNGWVTEPVRPMGKGIHMVEPVAEKRLLVPFDCMNCKHDLSLALHPLSRWVRFLPVPPAAFSSPQNRTAAGKCFLGKWQGRAYPSAFRLQCRRVLDSILSMAGLMGVPGVCATGSFQGATYFSGCAPIGSG